MYAIFLLQKCDLQEFLTFFFSKNTGELDIVLTKTVNILTTDEFFKPTLFWKTGLFSKTTTFLLILFVDWMLICVVVILIVLDYLNIISFGMIKIKLKTLPCSGTQ